MPTRTKITLEVFFLAFSTLASYLVAWGLRLDFDPSVWGGVHTIVTPLIALLIFRIGAYARLSLFNTAWRYTSLRDVESILKAHASSTVLLTCSVLLLRINDFPRSVIFMELALSVLFTCGARAFSRIIFERLSSSLRLPLPADRRHAVVLGGGNSGQLLIKNLLSNKSLQWEPVAVFDDSETIIGSFLHGIKVAGPIKELDSFLKLNPSVHAIIVAIPTLSQARLSTIREVCNRHSLVFKRMQSFSDIVVQDVSKREKDLSMEALLEKSAEPDYSKEVIHAFSGKRVLVTGAGGSIGSEIVRQLNHLKPSRIILLDNSEYNLFRMDMELKKGGGEPIHDTFVADIRDYCRLAKVFEAARPDVIFHAAAYKHVPMMEHHPSEAFKTNVLGTLNVLELCAAKCAYRFILISTDKAVQPKNIMGLSKRLAEILVKSFSQTRPSEHLLQTSIVRFGNVINSSGSVIPIFREQIESGGPITVTDPAVERFFMSTQQAVKLVLSASLLGKNGDLFVLDMGERIKIVDLAHKMLSLYGRKDIPIVFTGLRPGEILREEITADGEKVEPTEIPGISHVKETGKGSDDIVLSLKRLERDLPTIDEDELLCRMRKLL